MKLPEAIIREAAKNCDRHCSGYRSVPCDSCLGLVIQEALEEAKKEGEEKGEEKGITEGRRQAEEEGDDEQSK